MSSIPQTDRKPAALAFAVSVAALCAVAGATPALAGGPLLVDAAGSGTSYTWESPAGGLPTAFYNVEVGPLNDTVDNAAARAAVAAAFAAWEDIPTAAITYRDGGVLLVGNLPVDVDVSNFTQVLDVADGQSPIVFDADGSIFQALGLGPKVLGYARPDIYSSGAPFTIHEGFVLLNGQAVTGNPKTGFTLDQFAGVIVHEIGHFSNLAHSVTNGQAILFDDATGPSPADTFGRPPLSALETMFPVAEPYFGAELATPHADDVAMLSTLYPDAGFPTTHASIHGAVLDTDGATGLTGVNVIARNVNDPFNDAVSAISGDRTQGSGPLGLADGSYTLNGLTPGASYVVYTDEIRQRGFSTPLRTSSGGVTTSIAGPFPGPEELYNGAGESGDGSLDDPADFVALTVPPGHDVNIVTNVRATYPPASQANDHHFEGGTRGFPLFPDGSPVEIGPGEVHRIRFEPPALLDRPSHILLELKAGAPSTWLFVVESVRVDGARSSLLLPRRQGGWSFDSEFGVTRAAPQPDEVREIHLLVYDQRTSGGRRSYAFTADVVPQIRAAYAPDPATGTTATVRHRLPAATVHPGTADVLEVTLSAPVSAVEADYSAVDPAFDPAAVRVSGPQTGPGGAVYTIVYPLSYASPAPAAPVTVRTLASLGRQSFTSEDRSFRLALGGAWTYLYDAGQMPEDAGWIKDVPGRPRPDVDLDDPGILHLRLDGVDARLNYVLRAPFLVPGPLTVEFRVRHANPTASRPTQGNGYVGGNRNFNLGFVLNYLGSGSDKVGLDYVQEPFPPDQYNNVFMDTQDDFHVYRITLDGGGFVRVYVDGVQRLQAAAGTSSASLQEYGLSYFYSYEGFWDYVAFKAGVAAAPSSLPSPPTAR